MNTGRLHFLHLKLMHIKQSLFVLIICIISTCVFSGCFILDPMNWSRMGTNVAYHADQNALADEQFPWLNSENLTLKDVQSHFGQGHRIIEGREIFSWNIRCVKKYKRNENDSQSSTGHTGAGRIDDKGDDLSDDKKGEKSSENEEIQKKKPKR